MKIKQDIQTHTIFSDGKNTIKEMIRGAIDQRLESIVISDHAKGWIDNSENIEFFSTLEKYQSYLNQIEEVKQLFSDEIKVLSALEIEIGLKGNMKLDKGILEYEKNKPYNKFGVDVLIGSIHSESFEEDCREFNILDFEKREKLVENMCNLIKNKNIDVFAHPFQAIHGHFSDNLSDLEIEKILKTFKSEWDSDHDIHLEINGKKYPHYEQWEEDNYSLGKIKTNDKNFITKYKENGGKFVLGSDAHSVESLGITDFSIFDEVEIKEEDVFIYHEQ